MRKRGHVAIQADLANGTDGTWNSSGRARERDSAMTSETFSVRIRWQGSGNVDTCAAPFVQSGRLIDIVEDEVSGVVVMQAGRMRLELFIQDFAALFQGYDNALRFLRDAVEHKDFVEVRVMRERPAYYNPAQYQRIIEK
jgi:hypothetical protein